MPRSGFFNPSNNSARQRPGSPFYQGPERDGHQPQAMQLQMAEQDWKPPVTQLQQLPLPSSEEKALEKKTAETHNKESENRQQEAECNIQLISMIHKDVCRIKRAHPHGGKRSSKGAKGSHSSQPAGSLELQGAGNESEVVSGAGSSLTDSEPQFPFHCSARQQSSAGKAAFPSSSRTRLLYFRN